MSVQNKASTLESLRKLVLTNPSEAREQAGFHKNNKSLWPEIVKLFQANEPGITTCECGNKIEALFSTFSLNWLTAGSICNDCKRTEQEQERESARKNFKNFVVKNIENILAKRCNVPKRFVTAKKEDLATGLWDKVSCVLQGESVLLTGGAGRGKTHLAVAILREYFLNIVPTFDKNTNKPVMVKNPPVFCNVVDLLAEIRDTFKTDSQVSDSEVVDKYAKTQILALDDLGVEKTSIWSVQTLYRILNRRYESNMPLVITTNFSLEAIENNFNEISDYTGTRIISRLAEMGKVLNLTGEDKRFKT